MTRPNSGIPLDEWSGSAATERLHETITSFNQQSQRQTGEMIKLTRAIVCLTTVLVFGSWCRSRSRSPNSTGMPTAFTYLASLEA